MLTFEDEKAQLEPPMLEGALNSAQVLTTSDPNLQTVSSVTGINSEQSVDNSDQSPCGRRRQKNY